jgi:hypothetical protein
MQVLTHFLCEIEHLLITHIKNSLPIKNAETVKRAPYCPRPPWLPQASGREEGFWEETEGEKEAVVILL